MLLLSSSNWLKHRRLFKNTYNNDREIFMFRIQDPTVGAWFVNLTGQLIKVKLVLFDEDKLHRVLIQYLDGSTKLINQEDWFCLKLNKHIHQAGKSMQLH